MKCVTVLLLLSLCTVSAIAGSLDPSGPPAPTMKALDQVEPRTAITSLPFTISTSGSYYLVSNITLQSNTAGITINTDNVTIDLMGFALDGNKFFQTAIYASSQKNIVVKNGTISNWYNYGFYLISCANCRVENITAYNINRSAISVGKNSIISNCIVSNVNSTNDSAIYASGHAIIKDCTVSDCNEVGIKAVSGGQVISCTAKNNKSYGIFAANAIVKNCVATFNTKSGIYASSGSMVIDCISSYNGDNGIYLSYGTAINNVCTDNGTAFAASAHGAGIMITSENCRAESNTVLSNDYGIYISASLAVVVKNSANNNGSGTSYNYATFSAGNGIGEYSLNAVTATPWANFSF